MGSALAWGSCFLQTTRVKSRLLLKLSSGWKRKHQAPRPYSVSLWFDSSYAHDVITGQATAEQNQELVHNVQAIFQRVSQVRCIQWCEVKAHSKQRR